MQGSLSGLFDVDWTNFDPWRVRPVTHRLATHRLFRLESLVELGRRLEAVGRIRTHSDEVYAGTAFNHAPMLYPNGKSAAETLTGIADARAWMSLLNVQTDDLYRTLVDEVLDDVRPHVERADPGMSYRAGWIFVTSPRTVTPFHMDKEHNFIVQIQGRKRLYVWEPDDVQTVSEAARDLFHASHSRDLVVWNEAARARAHVFDLEPGMGAYMPSTSPHLVENGDGPSITASFTYYTHATRRRSRLHAWHQRLRTLGVAPTPVGHRPLRDVLVHAGCRAAEGFSSMVDRARGRARLSDFAPYAHANMA
jgi:hypothetical protein